MASIYLESGSKFWKCSVKGALTTTVTGPVGSEGRPTVKNHGNPGAALQFLAKASAEKTKEGYSYAGKGKKAGATAKAKAAAPAATAKKRAASPTSSPSTGGGDAKRRKVAPAAKASSGRSRASGSGKRTVDSGCTKPGLSVIGDHSIKLNQTHIEAGKNNNKYYIIQALHGSGQYFCWQRWGRVGHEGQNMLQPCGSEAQAIKEFESKFQSKTSNKWENKDSFVPKPGKYYIVDTEDSAGGGDAPMGKLTEKQINKGQGVLDKLGKALRKPGKPGVDELTSEFYSLIPHDFGFKKPPAIDNMNLLEQKVELLKLYLRMGFDSVESDKSVTPIAGVMDLPVPKSLDDAAKGLCPTSAVSSCNAAGKRLSEKQAGKPKGSMDAKLYAAILLYTSNAIYTELNKCLRDKNRTKIQKYFKYLRLFFEATKTLPQGRKTLWRGVAADLSKDPEYAPGKTVTWWGVSSCTSEASVAKNFASGCGPGSTVFSLQAKSACDIAELSFYKGEKESLLCPGTQLKVKSRKTGAGGITELVMEEVGRAIN